MDKKICDVSMELLLLILSCCTGKRRQNFPTQHYRSEAGDFSLPLKHLRILCYSLGVWESVCLSGLPPTRSLTEIYECLWSHTLPNIYTSNQEFRNYWRQSGSCSETNLAQWKVNTMTLFYIISLLETPSFLQGSECVTLCSV